MESRITDAKNAFCFFPLRLCRSWCLSFCDDHAKWSICSISFGLSLDLWVFPLGFGFKIVDTKAKNCCALQRCHTRNETNRFRFDFRMATLDVGCHLNGWSESLAQQYFSICDANDMIKCTQITDRFPMEQKKCTHRSARICCFVVGNIHFILPKILVQISIRLWLCYVKRNVACLANISDNTLSRLYIQFGSTEWENEMKRNQRYSTQCVCC